MKTYDPTGSSPGPASVSPSSACLSLLTAPALHAVTHGPYGSFKPVKVTIIRK